MPKPPVRTVYLDCEYGGLNPSSRPWEVGAVVETPGGSPIDGDYLWHVDDFNAADADPLALDMAGFYDRHPRFRAILPGAGHHDAADELAAMLGTDQPAVVNPDGPPPRGGLALEHEIAGAVQVLTRGARVVACNPAEADVPRVAAMIQRAGLLPAWHYKPVCAYDLAFGALSAAGRLPEGAEPGDLSSGVLIRLLGVDRDEATAHNALADALYARDVYRAALGVRAEEPTGATPTGQRGD